MNERGSTVIEMLVALSAGMVVLLGTCSMLQASMRNSTRVVERVGATQQVRSVMQRMLDQLASTCLGPNVVPVRAGSTSTAISFLTASGSAPAPTPDLHTIAVSGQDMTDSTYLATGGAPPNWTFSATAAKSAELMANFAPAKLGSPPAVVPVFRYYRYVNGQMSATPLPVPLSIADAKVTAKVTISFAAAGGLAAESAISDSVVLRLAAPAESAIVANNPCG